MKIIDYKCTTCGQERTRVAFEDNSACGKSICCVCCRKQGLQPMKCEMAQLELKRLAMGKHLNKNDVKGLLLEKAVSDALYRLKIPHKHNPFDTTYPCYQNKRPDITIPSIDTVIECKNISKRQVDQRLSKEWLDKNVTKRRHSLNYRRKIVLFSYNPKKSLRDYLHMYGWKVYSLNEQLLTFKQGRKARGKLVRRFYWLSKKCQQTRKPIPKQQTQLRIFYPRKVAPHSASH